MPRRTTKPERLSPVLVRLIQAAEHIREDAEGHEIIGAARALREFGEMALWVLPICGVFVPSDQKVSILIDRVATRHLGLEAARTEFRKAVADIEPFERRDAIESAHGHVRAVSEDAYFYAGLALGVTMMTVR
jgi:hypothetical protein